MEPGAFFLVAVHGGAGYHAKSESKDAEIRHALRLACKTPLVGLNRGARALTAVEEAITVLEDESCLNAGFGANLTLDGSVECDAAAMDGTTGDFGSVGAVSGVKNPIKAARAILENARVRDVLGRVPPLMLVSNGAQNFARQSGVICVPTESMVSERSRNEWEQWRWRLDAALAPQSAQPCPQQDTSGLFSIQDTVGAIVWDKAASLAAGVSSGGLLLKQPGRVGEAAFYGAGCWAQDIALGACGVACSVSGTGEYIIRCTVAKMVAQALTTSSADETHDVLERVLGREFYDICLAHGNDDPNVGILVLTQFRDEDGILQPRLWCAFTSDSMSVGFASSLDPKPKSMVLRRPRESKNRTPSSLFISNLPLTRL